MTFVIQSKMVFEMKGGIEFAFDAYFVGLLNDFICLEKNEKES
jgi:hypothetical protein